MAQVTFIMEDDPSNPGKVRFRSEPTFEHMMLNRQLGVMKLTAAQETAFFIAACLKVRSEMIAKGRSEQATSDRIAQAVVLSRLAGN